MELYGTSWHFPGLLVLLPCFVKNLVLSWFTHFLGKIMLAQNLQCSAVHCTALHCTALHCNTVQDPARLSLLTSNYFSIRAGGSGGELLVFCQVQHGAERWSICLVKNVAEMWSMSPVQNVVLGQDDLGYCLGLFPTKDKLCVLPNKIRYILSKNIYHGSYTTLLH